MRNTHPALDALRGLYTLPSAAALAKALPDIGDALSAQCAALARGPTPDRCEDLAIQLRGAVRHVMALREATVREAATR